MARRFGNSLLVRGIGLLIALAGLWFQLTDQPGIAGLRDRLEHLAYDLRLNLGLPGQAAPHPDILVVTVDEESLQRVGRWPWPRERIAQLVRRLAEAGAAVLAFDFLFSEPEQGLRIPLGLLQDPRLPDDLRHALASTAGHAGDARLAEALAGLDAVLGFILHPESRIASAPPFAPPEFETGDMPADLLPVPELPGATFNLPVLSRAARGHGFLSVLPDEDGVIRRVPLLIRHAGRLYPSLALETARTFLLADRIRIESARTASGPVITGLRLADRWIPTDARGFALVPFHRQGNFRRIPAWRILSDEFDPAEVEGRILLLGATALALSDLRPTPVHSALPGVLIHASLLAGLLEGSLPVAPDWIHGANGTLIVLLGLLLIWLGPRLSAPMLIPTALGLLALLVGGNLWLWRTQGLALAMATPVLVLGLLTGWFAVAGFAQATSARRRLQDAFGQYVPPQIVERMAEAPEAWHDRGETREMTVLFADIRGFTTLSETLSAGELRDLLNRFFTPMTRVLFEHGATIDKYVGDMIMAFWNAPVDDPDHARHAVEAALSMRREMQRINTLFAREGLPALRIGIGINTGPMHVGDMGSEFRRAYTVLGDSVNLGSRLEGLTRLYGVDIVVGPATAEAATGMIFRPLDRIRVKGRHQAVDVFEPLGYRDAIDSGTLLALREWEAFLDCFRAARLQEARERLVALSGTVPLPLQALYRERLEILRQSPPPPDWDGAFERNVK